MDVELYLKNLPTEVKKIKGCVYCAYNKNNKKIYIGYTTTTLFRRISSHNYCCKHNNRNNFFHSSLAKHGKENFEWYVLDKSEDLKYLKARECYYINLFKSNNKKYGYNLSTGGESPTLNIESRKKISKKAIQRNLNGKRNPFFGKRHSEETRNHLSKIRKGNNIGNENPFFGKRHSEETRERLSKIRKELCKNSNIILNMQLAQRGRPVRCVNSGIEYRSIAEASRALGINKSTLKSHLSNRLKTCHGLKFEFINQECK